MQSTQYEINPFLTILIRWSEHFERNWCKTKGREIKCDVFRCFHLFVLFLPDDTITLRDESYQTSNSSRGINMSADSLQYVNDPVTLLLFLTASANPLSSTSLIFKSLPPRCQKSPTEAICTSDPEQTAFCLCIQSLSQVFTNIHLQFWR